MIDDIRQPLVEPVRTESKFGRIAGAASVGKIAFNGISHVLLGFWALMVIFPFLWMIMTSFKTDPEILFSPWNLPAFARNGTTSPAPGPKPTSAAISSIHSS